jgi:hypothetical protein
MAFPMPLTSLLKNRPSMAQAKGPKGGAAPCSTMTSLLIEGMDRLCHGLTFYDTS